jgi:TolA-binding protein
LESRHHAGLSTEGEETIEKLSSFWERWGKIVLGVAGAALVISVGTYLYLKGRNEQEGAAAAKLAEASMRYWQGDYARSTEVAKQVASQYASTAAGTDAHRLLGDNAFWTGDFKTAVTEYRQYVAKAPSGLLADAGRRSLAYALESDRQFEEAAKTYEGLVGKLDRNSSAEFLMAAARCNQALGHTDKVRELLRRIDAEYGETSYAQLARMRLAALEAFRH